MTDFDSFKKGAVNSQPVFYDTTVGELSLEAENALKVEGARLPMNPAALDGLVSLFGMNKTFARKYDELVGTDERLQVMDRFREALATNDNMGVTLAIDESENTITGISERAPRVSMQGFFELVEDVLDRYGLEIGRFSHNMNGVTVATKSKDRSIDITYLEEESYKSGLEFTSDMGQVDFRYMLEREICTNGMTAMMPADTLRLTSLKDEAVEKFFGGIRDLAERNFMPEDFTNYLDRAIETPASVAEVSDAFEVLKKASQENGNPNLLSHINMSRIRAAYQDNGNPVEEMSRTEMSNALTDIPVHDVVNEITWVASHPDEASKEGFEVTSNRAQEMQAAAGDLMMKKNLDSENLVPSPFSVN